jgi:hypothetical protein
MALSSFWDSCPTELFVADVCGDLWITPHREADHGCRVSSSCALSAQLLTLRLVRNVLNSPGTRHNVNRELISQIE